MTNETVEQAVRRACDALLRGDIMSAMADLSPEAMNEAMTMGSQIMMLPMPQSYEIVSHQESEAGHHFVVRFRTATVDLVARSTWRQIDGAWKITSISADGMPPVGGPPQA